MTPGKGTNRITSPYGWRTINGKREFHNGQDSVITGPARAIWDCIKVELVSGYNGGRGNTAYLYYSNTLRVLYQHLAKFLVKSGQKVKQGADVGIMGNTGYSFGAHLHAEVQVLRGGRWTPINPAQYTEVPNVVGSHKGNDNLDRKGEPSTLPDPAPIAPLSILTIGPASPGDKNTIESMAKKLLLPVSVVDNGNNLATLTIGPASTGDRLTLTHAAEKLLLPVAEKTA